MRINRPHCIHSALVRRSDGTLQGVEYCCRCGSERRPSRVNVSERHGLYLRGEVWGPAEIWGDACPNEPRDGVLKSASEVTGIYDVRDDVDPIEYVRGLRE